MCDFIFVILRTLGCESERVHARRAVKWKVQVRESARFAGIAPLKAAGYLAGMFSAGRENRGRICKLDAATIKSGFRF